VNSASITHITDSILHLCRNQKVRANAGYFFFAKTSSTTAQMPAIVNGFEMTR
jgi:hypothetical protein